VAAVLILDALPLLSTTLGLISLALLLALAIEPVVRAAEARRVHRSVAVGVISVVGAAIAATLTVFVLPSAIQQLQMVQAMLPEIADQVLAQPSVQWLQTSLGTSVDLGTATTSAVDLLRDPSTLIQVSGGVLAAASGAVELTIESIFALVLTVFFSLSLPSIRSAMAKSIRRSRRESGVLLAEEIFSAIGRYVAGQLVLSVANGLVILVTLFVAGGPAPLLLALFGFVATLVPLVGTPIGFTVAALAASTVSASGGILVGAVLVVYMLVESYLLVPLVMRKAVDLPGSLVIISGLAGAALGGIMGAFFAVPLVASVVILWRRLVVPRQMDR
jgi:predicted PurR-regulated permease PerM